MTKNFNIIQACNDPKLFKPWFDKTDTWDGWFAFLHTVFALPMGKEYQDIFRECTKREQIPRETFEEIWLVIGRRGGKALCLNTEIPTPEGIKLLKDIHPGDFVFNRKGVPIKVLAETSSQMGRPCYKITFDDGTSFIADEEHEWLTYTSSDRRALKRREEEINPEDWLEIKLHGNSVDIRNQKFDKLVAIRPVLKPPKSSGGHIKWLCKCDCGRFTIKQTNNLRFHSSNSCGCQRYKFNSNISISGEIRTTKQIKETLYKSHAIPISDPILGTSKELTVEPYLLGVWLGDGSHGGYGITTMDDEIVHRIRDFGYEISSGQRINLSNGLANNYTIKGLSRKLRTFNITGKGNKRIPEIYFQSNIEDRWELLRGLMDTDGTAAGEQKCQYFSELSGLAKDVQRLICSLGIRASLNSSEYILPSGRKNFCYTVTFRCGPEAFLLSRKSEIVAKSKQRAWFRNWRYIRNVEDVESVPVKCIQVDSDDGLYLIGRQHVITHNSRVLALIAIYLACFKDWRPFLSPGERATIVIIATDRRQSRVIFRYIEAFLKEVPMLKPLIERDTSELFELKNQVNIEIHTASFRTIRGYALSVNTPIPTPSGFKKMGDLEIGDEVFDEKGKKIKITNIFDRMPNKAFRFTFSDGTTIDADAEHQWVTWDHRSRRRYYMHGLIKDQGVVPDDWPVWSSQKDMESKGIGRPISKFGATQLSSLDIANSMYVESWTGANLPNHAIPNCLPLEIGPRDLLIDPYLFGLWLGDGTKKTGVIATNFANGDSEWIQSSFEEKGYKLVRRNEYSFSIYGLQTELRTIGALKNKNIPDKYLWASRSQRLALLQGFMDSDGYVNPDRKQVSLTATRKEHAEAVAFLARSLGQKPTLKKYKRTEGCPGKTHDYSVSWTSTINPFRLPRKVATWEGNKISKLQNVSMRTIVSCEEIDPSPMRCITVDSSNAMYLCGKSLIPTHNTVAAALFDEMAFWRSEDAANPDREILAAIRPAMATIPESMLLCASSPYARRGALYDTWKRYYGEDNNRVLVWQAPSWIMNPSLSQEWLDEEFEKDAASARAEYGAEFRTDVENFINEEVLDACTPPHRFELPYIPEFNYVAFTDPSGGSKDSFTLAISHYDSDKDKCILDAIREVQPPFSPEEVTREFAALIRQYHITTVIGDRYGGEWPRERFMEHGVVYEPADKVKSEVYRELLPLINSGKVELLEHKRMVNQFLLLERRTRRGGKDSIDHPPNTHDDIANVVAGALVYSDQGEMVDIW